MILRLSGLATPTKISSPPWISGPFQELQGQRGTSTQAALWQTANPQKSVELFCKSKCFVNLIHWFHEFWNLDTSRFGEGVIQEISRHTLYPYFHSQEQILLPTQVKVHWYVITGLCVIWRIFLYIFDMQLWQNLEFFPATDGVRVAENTVATDNVQGSPSQLQPGFMGEGLMDGSWMCHFLCLSLERSKSSNNAREWSHGPNFKASIWKSLEIDHQKFDLQDSKRPTVNQKNMGMQPKGLADLIW